MITLDPVFELAIRFSFGLLFATSVIHKLRDPVEFTATVESYFRGLRFGTSLVARLAAVIIIGMEIAVVSLCLLPDPLPFAAAAASVLILYAVAMGANIARGNLLLDCGCAWAAERHPVSIALVARNLVLAAIASVLFLPTGGVVHPVHVLTALILSSMMLLIYAACSQLILNGQWMKVKSL